MGEERIKEEPGSKEGLKNGYKVAGRHKTRTGRRAHLLRAKRQGCRVPGSALGILCSSLCCLPCLAGAPTSGWSSWLSGLFSLPARPPTHHLEVLSSAIRGEGYGGHPHEMERPADTRMLVGLWLRE